MLTLFTGGPGAGKTAQMVAELEKLLKVEPNRPVYADGVEGLTIPHTPFDARRWHLELPDGALALVDEAQRHWRPTGPGQKPGDDITELETHRHRGIDLWITTQGPRLLHGNVRALVGRHIHLRDTGWLGRWWYEWPECNEGLMWKTCPVKFKHKLPKHVFSLYKSASLHVKPQRRTPMLAYIALALLIALAVLAFMVVRSLRSHTQPSGPSSAAVMATASTPQGIAAGPGVVPVNVTDPTAFAPRWAGRPESAPAYAHLLRVQTFPRVVAGFCLGVDQHDCRCFTQQGTDAGLSVSECREWNNHRPFDPYREPAAVAAPAQPPSVSPSGAPL